MIVSVLYTYIVSCMQRYRHIRSPPSTLHSSTLSLPLIFIIFVQFYCHLHSFKESFLPVLCSSHESATRQLRHTPFQHRKIWEPDKTHIFSTSKAHAATITTITTTTVIITNLPQFFSSEPSPQLSLRSHTKNLGIHVPFGHCQWYLEHFHLTEQQTN